MTSPRRAAGGRRIKGPFTAYPRWWRAFLPILRTAELRVLAVIIENTCGWNRVWVRLSLREIAAAGGLNKSNVPKALDALIKARVVAQRVQHGRKCYRLLELGEPA